jgi:hypothetical protein
LAGAKEMIHPRFVVSGIKILVRYGLAVDRPVFTRRANPSASAQVDLGRKENDERNNDDRNNYDPKPILMAANCTEHNLQ